MKIIKLNAIDSTNSFLKDLCKNSPLENYTVVTTDNQLNGRGQMNSNWVSEPYKNLTFSTLINKVNLSIENSRYINFCASIAVYNVLLDYNIPNLSIKWPNDIMSGNDKICGILVENTFTSLGVKNSIIGIGLNVNQEKFTTLKKVSSLKNLTGKEYNLEELRVHITSHLKKLMQLLNNNQFVELEKQYLLVLYKKGIVATFKDKNNLMFNGKIIGISKNGNLEIETEKNTIKQYGIKEIKFL